VRSFYSSIPFHLLRRWTRSCADEEERLLSADEVEPCELLEMGLYYSKKSRRIPVMSSLDHT